MDCGPTSLQIIAKYYGKEINIKKIRKQSGKRKEGVSFDGLAKAAKSIGLQPLAVKIDFKTLVEEVPLPCIAHLYQNHFIVVYKIEKNCVHISDSALGLISYSKREFIRGWIDNRLRSKKPEGYILILKPSPYFLRGLKKIS